MTSLLLSDGKKRALIRWKCRAYHNASDHQRSKPGFTSVAAADGVIALLSISRCAFVCSSKGRRHHKTIHIVVIRIKIRAMCGIHKTHRAFATLLKTHPPQKGGVKTTITTISLALVSRSLLFQSRPNGMSRGTQPRRVNLSFPLFFQLFSSFP